MFLLSFFPVTANCKVTVAFGLFKLPNSIPYDLYPFYQYTHLYLYLIIMNYRAQFYFKEQNNAAISIPERPLILQAAIK